MDIPSRFPYVHRSIIVNISQTCKGNTPLIISLFRSALHLLLHVNVSFVIKAVFAKSNAARFAFHTNLLVLNSNATKETRCIQNAVLSFHKVELKWLVAIQAFRGNEIPRDFQAEFIFIYDIESFRERWTTFFNSTLSSQKNSVIDVKNCSNHFN